MLVKSLTRYIFYLTCWVIATILTGLQIHTYYENEDLVDIQYKLFRSSSTKGSYPEFSVCLSTAPDNQFDENKLPKDIKSKDLVEILNGNRSYSDSTYETNDNLQQFLIDFSENQTFSYDDLLRVNIRDTIMGYVMLSEVPVVDGQQSIQGYNKKLVFSEGTTNFRKSFEKNRLRCWTRQVMNDPGQIIKSEGILFAKGSLFQGNVLNGFVFLHHENQLIRAVDTNIRVGEYMFFLPDPNKVPTLVITVTQVKVIIRRHDSNFKCDQFLNNDDEKFLQTASDMIGCIPLFWKDLSREWSPTFNMSFCTKPYQYEQFWKLNFYQVFNKYTPPCKKISVTYDVSTKEDYPEVRAVANGDLLVNVLYRTEEYEEVYSRKKFDAESLFSQVGGLIGIMVGVSFIHIPDLLQKIVSKAKIIHGDIESRNQQNDSSNKRNIITYVSKFEKLTCLLYTSSDRYTQSI